MGVESGDSVGKMEVERVCEDALKYERRCQVSLC